MPRRIFAAYTDKGIKVAIAIEIGEAGDADKSHIDASEGIGSAHLLGEDRGQDSASVAVVAEGAALFPDQGVQVAIAIEIGEAGFAAIAHIDAIEGIVSAGLHDEER